MPTIYRWDDASAPDLTGAAGGLMAVLDGCLVNGYGANAAAGWSTAYTGTNKRAYLQGTGSNGRYLRVDDTGTGNARVVGYEAMSDIDTGTGPWPTAAQVSGGGYFRKSSTTDGTARPWLVAADAKRFYLWVGYNVAEGTGLAANATPLYFFGDLLNTDGVDAYNTLLMCGESASSLPTSGTVNIGAVITGHYIPRNYAASAGALNVLKLSDMRALGATSGAMGVAGSTYPDPVTSGMILSAVSVMDLATKIHRGVMPGLYNPLHNLPGASGDTFTGYGGQSGRGFILLDTCNAGAACRIALETTAWE